MFGKLFNKFNKGYDERPVFFIVGTGRCGTTLLKNILSSHQEIEVFPGEGNELWHPDLYPYKERKHEEVFPYWYDPVSFTHTSLQNWGPSYKKKMLKKIDRAFTSSPYSKVHVIKSAMISFMLPEIMGLFPNASFIHVYRKGVPVVRSYYEKEAHKYSDWGESPFKKALAEYWNSSVLTVQNAPEEIRELNEKNFLSISYEMLCDQPELELRRLAHFMEITSEGHSYDLSKIRGINEEAYSEFEVDELLPRMKEGHRKLGYQLDN